jgi:hypothetical protein
MNGGIVPSGRRMLKQSSQIKINKPAKGAKGDPAPSVGFQAFDCHSRTVLTCGGSTALHLDHMPF